MLASNLELSNQSGGTETVSNVNKFTLFKVEVKVFLLISKNNKTI